MSRDSPENHNRRESLLTAIDRGGEGGMPPLIELIYAELKRLAHF